MISAILILFYFIWLKARKKRIRKKGYSYNTGIHDLKGETMLDLLSDKNQRNYSPISNNTRLCYN